MKNDREGIVLAFDRESGGIDLVVTLPLSGGDDTLKQINFHLPKAALRMIGKELLKVAAESVSYKVGPG